MVVKKKTIKGGAVGEERIESMSYYKEDWADEMMNEYMRKMSTGQGGKSPAKQHQLSTLLPSTSSYTI